MKSMKEKIVGILVCMLLIATAVPAVTSVKTNTPTNTAIPGANILDVARPMVASYQNWDSTPPVDPAGGFWIQGQKILASDGRLHMVLGVAIFVDGDTALIGADGEGYENETGAAYVFTRTGTTWSQQAKLLASDAAPGDAFGVRVSLSGDTALVGACYSDDNGANSGSAYVFTRSGTTWTQQAKLLPSDGAADDQFGIGIALSGDTAFIGANRNDDYGSNSGSVYVFTRSGTTWTQQTILYPSDATTEQRFGVAAYIEGDTAIIGANGDKNALGAAYIFTRTGGTWTQQQKLNASDAGIYANFGHGVSLSGETALIGAPTYMGQGTGSAYVFVRNGTTWTRQAKLLAADGKPGDGLGWWQVSIDGDVALVGAPWYQHQQSKGAAYVFTRTGTTWSQQVKLLASDGLNWHSFGCAVFLDGNTALIGAPGDDDQGNTSGSVYVFTKVGLNFSITGGLGVNLKIKNEGTMNATGIPWQLQVNGGLLWMINKTLNGTINIPAGQTKTVGTGMLIGFGALTITAKVADEEQTTTGFQIIVYSMVKK
jgi:hypothetical protein